MHVLLAPDRFSGTLTAVAAARALARGWRESAADDVVSEVPMSDGAAGLLDVVAAARGGTLVPVTVPGPLGVAVPAAVLHVPGPGGGTAYVEADQVLGAHLVAAADRRRAATAGTSAGLGELLLAAVGSGAGRVVVGLGPGVVHDAGAGLLAVLGGTAAAGDRRDDLLEAGGLALADLRVDDVLLAAARDALGTVDVVLALADDAPLLGLHGAGAILGQDPGVGPAVAQELERALGHATTELERTAARLVPRRPSLALADGAARPGPPVAARSPGAQGHSAGGATGHAHGAAAEPARLARRSGTGAGGGAAFLLRLLGARALAGAELVADAVDLAGHVARADLVVTGGRVLDAAALTESVPATVGRLAMARGLPVVAVAEEVHTSRREVAQIGISGTYEVVERRRAGVAAPAGETGTGHPVAPAPAELLAARGSRIARTWSS
ncbi:glycerate kinase [Georgenia yuyongxinii]|uniref:glycerate kinase n=1 Tax=Georgenia yuyongxinii TaxID=2589797 RepID=UPI00143DB55E|nr:glycerate kinase [Georgenia yuyongxinii]